jgi:hypothetical protein
MEVGTYYYTRVPNPHAPEVNPCNLNRWDHGLEVGTYYYTWVPSPSHLRSIRAISTVENMEWKLDIITSHGVPSMTWMPTWQTLFWGET